MNRARTTLPALLLAFLPATIRSATITPGDPAAGGIGYTAQVSIGGIDSITYQNHVSAWSWEDQSQFDASLGQPPVGWTHTSNWIALTVTSASTLTLTLDRNPNVPFAGAGNIGGFAPIDHLFPSVTIWSGWDNDDADFHTYNNVGAVSWAEDLAYLDHVNNSALTSISRIWNLAPGQYTLAIGSNSPSSTSPPRQGYSASFSAIPEPSFAVLAPMALAILVCRRRTIQRRRIIAAPAESR